MKFLKTSNHGQELIVITALLIIVSIFAFFKYYQQQLYKPGQAACVADCTQVEGSFRRYMHNIFSTDQCICMVDDEISDIWN